MQEHKVTNKQAGCHSKSFQPIIQQYWTLITIQLDRPVITIQLDQPVTTAQQDQPVITIQLDQPVITIQLDQPVMTITPNTAVTRGASVT